MDSMMDIYSRCRLCAGVHTLGINIFGDEGTRMNVRRKISTYLSLEVEMEDALPKNICYLCLGRIEEFHKFKTMCSEAQLTLKNWTHCLDDEDMSFCAEHSCTSGFEEREESELYCTSYLSTEDNATPGVSAEQPNGQHLEGSSNGHSFSTKKRQKINNGASAKVMSNRNRLIEQNSSETLITKVTETYINMNGLCNATFSRYSPVPSRRFTGSQSKNTTQHVIQLDDLGTTSDDDDDEPGFPGFIAERHGNAAEFGCKLEMDSGPSSQNEMVEESTRQIEQSQWNEPDGVSLLESNIGRVQSTHTISEAEMYGVKQEPDEEGYTQYKCNACHHIFTRKSTLNQHLNSHAGNNPYKCPSCRKPFKNNYTLKLHMRMHTNDALKCPDCNLEFSQKSILLDHMQIHQRVNEPASRTSNEQFLQQTGTVPDKKHKKQKRYCCKYCKASFLNKHSCTDHMRCHFGEKPYNCSICDKRFTRQVNLLAHLKVHINEPVVVCRLCNLSFTSRAHLTEHLSLAHRDVILEVVNDANTEDSN